MGIEDSYNFNYSSYSAEELKNLLSKNGINCDEVFATNENSFNSIFEATDLDGSIHGENDSTKGDKTLSGKEINLFLSKISKFVGNKVDKIKEDFKKAELQKHVEKLYQEQGASASRKNGIDKLSLNELESIVKEMEAAKLNKTTGKDGAEIYSYKSVNGKFSPAAKELLKDFGISIGQLQDGGKFDTLQIKILDGKRTAIFSSSSAHTYVFEVEDPKDVKQKRSAAEESTSLPEISYENITEKDENGHLITKQVMRVSHVNIKNVDINMDSDKEHTFIYSDSSFGHITNKSGHPTHLVSDGKSGYDDSYLTCYTTTTNSDDYTINYVKGKESKEKFSKTILLGPGSYAQWGKADAQTIAGGGSNMNIKVIYRPDPKTGELQKYGYGSPEFPFKPTENGLEIGDVTSTNGFIEYSYYKVKNKDGSAGIQQYRFYIKADGENAITPFYDSRLTVDAELKHTNPIVNKRNHGFEEVFEALGSNNETAIKKDLTLSRGSDGYNFLTQVCKLNSQKIDQLIAAGFTKISLDAENLDSDDKKSLNISFINTTKNITATVTLANLVNHIEEMEISDKNGNLSFNNMLATISVDGEQANPLNFGNGIFTVNMNTNNGIIQRINRSNSLLTVNLNAGVGNSGTSANTEQGVYVGSQKLNTSGVTYKTGLAKNVNITEGKTDNR